MREQLSSHRHRPGWRRRTFAVAVLAVLGLALPACGGGNGAASSSNGAQINVPSSVTIAMGGGPDVVYASFLVAQSRYFPELTQKYGVTFNVATTSGGAQTMAALSGGGASTIGLADPVAATNAYVNGQKVVAVFNNFVGYGVVFVARKEYESTLGTDVARFADRTWGYAAPSGGGYAATAALAAAHGLDLKNLPQVATGDFASMLPALQAGRIDIVGMATATAAAAVNQGVGYVVASSHDPEFQSTVSGGRKIGSLIVMPQAFLTEYPEFAQELVNALVRARTDLQGASADSVRGMLAPDVADKTDPQVWSTAWSLAQPSIQATDGTFSDTQLKDTLDQQVKDGVLPSAADGEGLFNSSYVETAYQQLGLTSPTSP